MKGILVFNNGRPDIAYKNGTMYGVDFIVETA